MVRFYVVKEIVDYENHKTVQLIEGMCLSTDAKPTAGIATGSIMTEVDTGNVHFFDEVSGEWIEQMCLQD